MRSIAHAHLRGRSARSAARRGVLLLIGLAAIVGTASGAAAAVDKDGRAVPSMRRTAEARDLRATKRARSLRADRRRHGRSAHRRLDSTAPGHALVTRHVPAFHAPALRQAMAHEAAGEAAREWRPHAAHPHGRARRLGTMLASLGRELMLPPMPQEQSSLSGAPIRWVASADCLAMPLRTVLAEVAQSFGHLQVNSTCRSARHNARVGGAKRSFHLSGHAADFRVSSSPRAVLAFLRARTDVGGLKHYGGGLFHIDTGPRRSW